MQNGFVFRRTAAIIVLALVSAFVGVTCGKTPGRPLNLLLITVDTFRADRIGDRTPALTRFARDSIRFDAADSPVPLTLPAHASLMSGLLPRNS